MKTKTNEAARRSKPVPKSHTLEGERFRCAECSK